MTISDSVRQFFDDLTSDVVEERVIEYVIREVHNGRRLTEVMNDPYVRNRLNEEKRASVLENTDIVEALEQEIRSTMDTSEFGLSS